MSQQLLVSPEMMAFREKQITYAELTANCKTKSQIYGVFNAENDLTELRHRPNICASPFCPVCVNERKTRYLKAWLPFVDDDFYPRQSLRHIIATTPAFPCSELCDRIETMLKNVSKFHKEMGRSYGYAFKAIVLLELKKEPDSMYYFHLHYGVLSFVNIGRMRSVWCDAWQQQLVVKFPSYKGRPQFYTNKIAFIKYISKRRSQQGLVIPQHDYYFHLSKRRLIRKVGFSSQDITRIMTISCQKYADDSNLPAGYVMIYLGNLEKNANLAHFCERYRAAYESLRLDADEVFSPAAAAVVAFDRLVNPKPEREIQTMTSAERVGGNEFHVWDGPTTF